jgi:hypothetical protein
MIDDLLSRLTRYLITGGINGRSQAHITGRFRHAAKSDELQRELEFLQAQEKVERFVIPTTKRNKIVWRATDKILKTEEESTLSSSRKQSKKAPSRKA